MSLALSTLLYEWRRYMAAIVALAFSGLLVLAQVGMFNMTAIVRPGVDPAQVDKRMQEILADFLKNGPTADEVQRAVRPEVHRAARSQGVSRGL